MRISTFVFGVLLALAIGLGAYWYVVEGAELLQQIREADNKPFMLR